MLSFRYTAGLTGTMALGIGLLFGACVQAQYPSPPVNAPPPVPPVPPVFVNSKAPDYGPASERTITFKDLQNQRYLVSRLKSMASDADKLLKLAKELSKEADGASDVRTVNEIAKLAHSVKWKMQLVVDETQNH